MTLQVPFLPLGLCLSYLGRVYRNLTAGSGTSDPHGCHNSLPVLRVVMLDACQAAVRE